MYRSDKIGPLAEYGDFFGREKEIRKVNGNPQGKQTA